MSDILADIEDNLTDWNGSKDSMRWTANDLPVEGTLTPEQAREALALMTSTLAPVVQAMVASLTPAIKRMNDTLIPMARALGFLPPPPPRRSLLDARYHQRQKNRRKRQR